MDANGVCCPCAGVAAPAAATPERAPRLSAYARRLSGKTASAFAAQPGIRYDFRYGRPALDEFPRQIWRRLLASRAKTASRDALGYGSPAGDARLRGALAEYLGRARGMDGYRHLREEITTDRGADAIRALLADVGLAGYGRTPLTGGIAVLHTATKPGGE